MTSLLMVSPLLFFVNLLQNLRTWWCTYRISTDSGALDVNDPCSCWPPCCWWLLFFPRACALSDVSTSTRILAVAGIPASIGVSAAVAVVQLLL